MLRSLLIGAVALMIASGSPAPRILDQGTPDVPGSLVFNVFAEWDDATIPHLDRVWVAGGCPTIAGPVSLTVSSPRCGVLLSGSATSGPDRRWWFGNFTSGGWTGAEVWRAVHLNGGTTDLTITAAQGPAIVSKPWPVTTKNTAFFGWTRGAPPFLSVHGNYDMSAGAGDVELYVATLQGCVIRELSAPLYSGDVFVKIYDGAVLRSLHALGGAWIRAAQDGAIYDVFIL